MIDRWCRIVKVGQGFEKLTELILLEEFKNSVSPEIKLRLIEHKVVDLKNVVVFVDDYELTHKTLSNKLSHNKFYRREWGIRSQSEGECMSPKRREPGNHKFIRKLESGEDKRPGNFEGPTCHYCKKKGHLKAQCWKLREKTKRDKSESRPVCHCHPKPGNFPAYGLVCGQVSCLREKFQLFLLKIVLAQLLF